MGTKIYGILAAENKDRAGETVILRGVDTSMLGPIIDEHPDDPTFFTTIGAVTEHAKIFSAKDCDTPEKKRCWDHALVPFLFIKGELADDTDHPNAKAAGALVRFAARPDIPLTVGFSVDGGIFQRTNEAGHPDEKGKILAQTLARRASMTVDPCNSKCVLFSENDLTKSMPGGPIPDSVQAALRKSWSGSSFVDSNDRQILNKLQRLKKSLGDYYAAWTGIKCHHCAKSHQFFKAGNVPNGCNHCGNAFTLSQIWAALNR